MRKVLVAEAASTSEGIFLTSLPTFGGTSEISEGISNLVLEAASEVEAEVFSALGKVYSTKQIATISSAFSKLKVKLQKEVKVDCAKLAEEIQAEISNINL